jgi:Ca2+-binding RTX toxin-like protein
VLSTISYTLGAAAQVELLTTTNAAGTGAINLTGNNFVQNIIGNAGANTLNGLGGADTMQGLAGDDRYIVDNAADLIVETTGGGTGDRVFTSVSYTLGAAAQVEILNTNSNGGTAAINLTGNAFVQNIIGNAGANTLNGLGGADTMQGLTGDDRYIVDNAGDIIVEGASGGSDRVFTSVSYALGAAAQVEILNTNSNGGTGAINLTGNAFAQSIIGNAGNNVLNGGAGGADTLSGLGGNDIFVFNTSLSSSNRDTVADYSVADDTIHLENAIFSGIAGTGVLTAAQFSANASGTAQDADDRIIYETDTGRLIYDSNGNVAGGDVHFATLDAGLAMTNADFFIV